MSHSIGANNAARLALILALLEVGNSLGMLVDGLQGLMAVHTCPRLDSRCWQRMYPACMLYEVVWGMVCRDASIEGRFQAMWARQKRGHDRAVISFFLAMFALRELRLFCSPGFAQVHSLHTQLEPWGTPSKRWASDLPLALFQLC